MKVKGLKKIESKKIPASIYIFTVKDEEGDIDLVVLDDIRKLVEGLLEEIENKVNEIDKKLRNPEIDEIARYQLVAGKYWLLWSYEKIKKWFAVVHYEAGNS